MWCGVSLKVKNRDCSGANKQVQYRVHTEYWLFLGGRSSASYHMMCRLLPDQRWQAV